MKVNGIIAEYNPFHNGHKYHLETSLARTGADYTIIAMSGNFMQRGTPAMIHKYARAEMALRNGADLVLEIPSFYACASAEYYAHGAVSLLDQLGVVDCLCFGSESGDVAVLTQIAEILTNEPAAYGECLTTCLKQGHSYPTARSMALTAYLEKNCPSPNEHCCSSEEPVFSFRETADVFTTPNNILGIEYIKALFDRNSTMKPVTLKRMGAQYHDQTLGSGYPSATAIRQVIHTAQCIRHNDITNATLVALSDQLPDSALHILTKTCKTLQPIQMDDFSQILLYKLLCEKPYGYEKYLDMSSDLSDKILKNLFQFQSYSGFCDLLKSKDITYTRLSRCLLHLLLDIKTEDMEHYKSMDYVPYARVLGLRKDAAPLLLAIKEHGAIPLVTKLADAENILGNDALKMLKRDIQVSHIYNGVEAVKCDTAIRNEYRTPIVVI